MDGLRTRLMRLAVGIVATIGFFASVLVNVASLQGVDVQAYVPNVWLLHLGVFIVVVPFVVIARGTSGNKVSIKELAGTVPPWVRVFGTALLAYTLVNFALSMIHQDGRKILDRGGEHLIAVGVGVFHTLTPAEYSYYRVNQLLGFSGHWMFFYFVSAAYFLFHRPPAASGTGPLQT